MGKIVQMVPQNIAEEKENIRQVKTLLDRIKLPENVKRIMLGKIKREQKQ